MHSLQTHLQSEVQYLTATLSSKIYQNLYSMYCIVHELYSSLYICSLWVELLVVFPLKFVSWLFCFVGKFRFRTLPPPPLHPVRCLPYNTVCAIITTVCILQVGDQLCENWLLGNAESNRRSKKVVLQYCTCWDGDNNSWYSTTPVPHFYLRIN